MARGKSLKTVCLTAWAHNILEEIQPASVRAVCYKLFTRGQIRNMSKNETNKISLLLKDAREREEIPWEWIVDDTRPANRAGVFEGAKVFSDAVCEGFRLDPWEQQKFHLEIWSEKGTVSGTLKPVLDRYAVTFRVFRGYASATLAHAIAQESADRDKPFLAFYLGDWDPSGLHMSEVDLPDRLARYDGDVALKRIALTSDDLADLPGFPLESKQQDARYAWYLANYGRSGKCWELDALDPNVLRDRVEGAILRYIEPDAWNRCEVTEQAQRDSLRTIQAQWVALCHNRANVG